MLTCLDCHGAQSGSQLCAQTGGWASRGGQDSLSESDWVPESESEVAVVLSTSTLSLALAGTVARTILNHRAITHHRWYYHHHQKMVWLKISRQCRLQNRVRSVVRKGLLTECQDQVRLPGSLDLWFQVLPEGLLPGQKGVVRVHMSDTIGQGGHWQEQGHEPS